ncbi:MAG TPA: hypothetical protein VHX60_00970 [Acidobacteriaceae bacterium]|nr:hypothetical protein [Acidobacteriaceae bacterium]
MAAFDLVKNPFWLLRTSIRARKQDVLDALESAISDEIAPESELLRAQQIILAPKTRIEAELSWLPDLAPSRAAVIVGILATNPPREIALQLLDGVDGLSRANVAADICRRYPGQVDLLDQLTESYEALFLADIEEAINANRKIAGFTLVDSELLKEALSKIENRHADCATVCLVGSPSPAHALSRVIGDKVQPGSLRFEFLEATVRSYRAWVGKRLQQIDDALQEEIAGMKLSPGDLRIAKRIKAGVGLWSEWNSPVELWDQAKGLEEPRSYAMCDKLRDFCIWLANDMEERAAALEITEGLRANFTRLPSMLKRLEEDTATLTRLVGEQGVSDALGALHRAVEVANASMPAVEVRLRSKGFNENSIGVVLTLYEPFLAAIASASGTEYTDIPWQMLRGVMIELNNQNHREASERLGRDLLTIADGKASAKFISLLQDDLRTVRNNIKWSEIDYFLKTGRRKEALRLIDTLIAEHAPGNDLDQLRGLAMKLQSEVVYQSRRTKKRALQWVIGIAFVCVCIAIKSCSDDQETSSGPVPAQSSISQVDANVPDTPADIPLVPSDQAIPTPDDGREIKPPIGSGRELSRDELRYCQFQHARITRAQSLSTSNDEIGAVNAAVDDFNARCSSFRYRAEDMTAVKKELSVRASDIDQGARRLLTGLTRP